MRIQSFGSFRYDRIAVHGILFAFALPLVGCGSERRGFDKGASNGSFDSPDGGPVDAPGADGCADAARLVYVVSQEDDLYSFAPDQKTFRRIGRLDCPTDGLAMPNSMAVDREGTAWVNYSDGSLFKVSTSDASCVGTTFERNQNGFLKFGMAFATDGSAGSTAETLYIAGLDVGGGGKGFGSIDLGTLKVTKLGDYSGALAGKGAELTGTGDGRLYGFFTTSPATLAQIDKTQGATSGERSLDGVNTGIAWAFSFWGGDFWFYTSDGTGASRVTQMKTSSSGTLEVVMEDVGGFRIVGAGVSTCAPTRPPK